MYMAGSTDDRIQRSNFSKQLRNALPVPYINPEIAVRPAGPYDLMMSAQFFHQRPPDRPTSTNY